MKIKFITNIVFYFLCQFAVWEQANSYPGGWTVMQMNDFNSHSFIFIIPRHLSIHLVIRRVLEEKDWQFHGGQFNYLIKD